MKRQPKEYKAELGDCTFYSQVSLAEAKKDKDCAIWAAFTGSYDPYVVLHRGSVFICYRDRPDTGWSYIFHLADPIDKGCQIKEGEVMRRYTSNSSHNAKPPEVFLAGGLYHFAQATWKPGDGIYAPSFVKGETERRAFFEWAHWQIRYRHFAAEGHSANVVHSMACDYGHYPEPALPLYEEFQSCR